MKYVAVVKRKPSEELKHWKYIKRKKVNGKWRYYYDQDQLKKDIGNVLGYDEKERLNAAKAVYDSYGYQTDDAELALQRSQNKVNQANQQYEMAKYYSDPNNPVIVTDDPGKVAAVKKISQERLTELERNAQKEIARQEAGRKAIAEYVKAQEAYKKTIIGIAETTINRGREIISSLFNRK